MPPPLAPAGRPLSDKDRYEMLDFFEWGEHQHLRAILIALTLNEQLGPAVLKTMKQDVLPYMESGITSSRMQQKVKRLSKKWKIPGRFSDPSCADPETSKLSLEDAPLWNKAYQNIESLIDPDPRPPNLPTRAAPSRLRSSYSASQHDCVERRMKWNADEDDHHNDERSGQPSTLRATKKRKIRESTANLQESTTTQIKPIKNEPSSPPALSSRENEAPIQSPGYSKARSLTQKENERPVPVEAVARRVLESSSRLKLETDLFIDIGQSEASSEDAPPSRPENPVASVLSGRDRNIASPPKRGLVAPKTKTTQVKRVVLTLPATKTPIAERNLPSRPRVTRTKN